MAHAAAEVKIGSAHRDRSMRSQKMKTIVRIGTGVTLAIALSLGCTGFAQAAPSVDGIQHEDQAQVGTPSQEEINELADAFETLFTRYIPVANGTYTVDVEAVQSDGLEDQMADFNAVAEMMNDPIPYSAPADRTTNSPQDATSYAKCVLGNALGIGIVNTPNLVAAVSAAIRAWNWGLAASTVIRIAGPIALRGVSGAAGLAALLAGAAWACRGQW